MICNILANINTNSSKLNKYIPMKNTYFLKGNKGENSWWRYLVMIIIVVVANVFGSIPYTAAIAIKAQLNGIPLNTNDFSSFSQVGLDKNLALFLLTLSFVAGLIALLVFLKPLHERSIKDTLTGRNKFDFNRFFFAVAVWGGLLLISFVIGYILEPENYTLQFNLGNFLVLLLVSVVFISMQASFEEIFFRGYLQQSIANLTKNAWIPLLITSFIFGLMHISNPEVKEFGVGIMLPQYILLGFMLGICVIMDEGLEIVLGVHIINNVLSSLVAVHESSVLQTDAIFKIKEINPEYAFVEITVLSAIFLAIMAYKYKWASFKKIFAKLEF